MLKKKLLLVDANSCIFRAYHALPFLSSPNGIPTNAILGFINILNKVFREQKPDYVTIVFDSKGPTVREKIFEEYKATRPETPKDLIIQIPYITEIIKAMGLKIIEKAGYEADDLIATIVELTKNEKIKTIIVTGDKDMMQLVSENVSILDTTKSTIIDSEGVKEKFGVTPEKIVDLLALTGDAVDNIPGIRGVGIKTAQRLIEKFGSIDEILLNLDKITSEKLKSAFLESEEQLRINKRLIPLDKNISIDFTQDDLKMKGQNVSLLKKLYKEFGFTRLLMELEPENSKEKEFEVIDNENKIKEFLEQLKNIECGLSILTDQQGNPDIKMLSVATTTIKSRAFIFSAERFRSIVENSSAIYLHGLKELLKLIDDDNLFYGKNILDIGLISYLINPNYPDHSLDTIFTRELGHSVYNDSDEQKSLFGPLPSKKLMDESCSVFEAGKLLYPAVQSSGLEKLYTEIELPLTFVLKDMEVRGIKADKNFLMKSESELKDKMQKIKTEIFSIAGEEFNIDSPKQLQRILFDKLKLPKKRKTKTGFSTDSEVLNSLTDIHELPKKLLEYRTVTKTLNTFVQPLLNWINPATGRIHPTFHQNVVATGRLSCSNPNLQNIPAKGEPGEELRRAFVSENGMVLLSADYSQIELRLLAHFSQDKSLLEKFHSGCDIHASTAAKLFNVSENDVTPELRRRAKVINFGIIYGMGPQGLSKELGISYEEAETYIDDYFVKYPGVKEYIEKTIEFAREKKYVRTIMGRRRPVPDILSTDTAQRAASERVAVNSVLQGSAADIVKIAMINIHKELKKENLHAYLLIQVHDELLLEIKDDSFEKVKKIAVNSMENAVELQVPLTVVAGRGRTWVEAHN